MEPRSGYEDSSDEYLPSELNDLEAMSAQAFKTETTPLETEERAIGEENQILNEQSVGTALPEEGEEEAASWLDEIGAGLSKAADTMAFLIPGETSAQINALELSTALATMQESLTLLRESGLTRLCVLRWRTRCSRRWLSTAVDQEKQRLKSKTTNDHILCTFNFLLTLIGLQRQLADAHEEWQRAEPGMEKREIQRRIDELESVVQNETRQARDKLSR